MINRIIQGWTNHLPSSLTLCLHQSYVIRYIPRRSTFNKTTYNEDWIPRQRLYHKKRKPRLPGWDDPNTIFPKLIPPLYKPVSHRHFVRTVIEQEEKQKAIRSKQYLLAKIRPGDIVDITFQQTFQNEQTVTHRCLVLAYKRRNSWTAALQVAIHFGGMPLRCIYLIHSPKVKKIELISKGSGCFNSNIKYNWQKMSKKQLTTPKIRKRVMKIRGGPRARKSNKPKTRTSPIKFDKVTSDNVRKLI